MIHLFDKIPPRFFNLLSSQAASRIYADCLMTVYEQYEREITYKLPREQLRDAISLYLVDAAVSDQAEADILLDEKTRSGESLTRQMASAILRRFCSPEVGWMEEEADDSSYTRSIIMTEQGLALCNFLLELEKPERVEFSSFIYNIFNTLEHREQWEDDPYVSALKNVYKNARDLSRALKALSTFIKKIIESMVHEETFESLTENLMGYFEGDFIKEYSRLTRRQNIHTFRRKILGDLQEMEEDESLMRDMVRGCAKEEGLTLHEAEDLVLSRFDATRRFLSEDYDRIMADIKHKINIYLQVAVGRARFLQTRGDRLKEPVEDVMRYLKTEIDAEEADIGDDTPEELKVLFNWDPYEFIDLSSVSYPRQNRHLKKDTSEAEAVLTREDLERTKKQIQKERNNPYSKKRAMAFLKGQIGEADSISAREMEIRSPRDMLLLLSAAAFAGEGGYAIRVEDGYFETQNMLIRNFSFYKEK